MKFRKKPVIIEAIQFNGLDDYLKIVKYYNENNKSTLTADEVFRYDHPIMIIRTLEGAMSASQGDYIIEGVNGEFYPCKPDIFEKTYELLE